MKHCIIILLWLAVTPIAQASSPSLKAMIAGEFIQARTLGREEGTIDGLMTACRAGMVIGGYYEIDEKAVHSLHGAIDDCRAVLEKDVTHKDARITLAIAIGFEGKRWRKPGLAKKSRAMLEQVFEDYPDDYASHGALGGWHSEVSAAGFLAKLYLGAKRKMAQQYFNDAFSRKKSDLPLLLEYIKFMARGKTSDIELALSSAESALRVASNEAIDTLMHDNIGALQAALLSNDKTIIKKAIAEATAFNGIEEWRTVPIASLDFLD